MRRISENGIIIIATLIIIFVIGYLTGLAEGKSYWFDENKAIKLIEEKINHTEKITGLSQMGFLKEMSINEGIEWYYRYGMVSEYCLRREVREICLSSEKS